MALMLTLPTEDTDEENEHLYGLTPSHMPFRKTQIIEENLDSHIETCHKEHRWQRGDRKILNGKGSLGL